MSNMPKAPKMPRPKSSIFRMVKTPSPINGKSPPSKSAAPSYNGNPPPKGKSSPPPKSAPLFTNGNPPPPKGKSPPPKAKNQQTPTGKSAPPPKFQAGGRQPESIIPSLVRRATPEEELKPLLAILSAVQENYTKLNRQEERAKAKKAFWAHRVFQIRSRIVLYKAVEHVYRLYLVDLVQGSIGKFVQDCKKHGLDRNADGEIPSLYVRWLNERLSKNQWSTWGRTISYLFLQGVRPEMTIRYLHDNGGIEAASKALMSHRAEAAAAASASSNPSQADDDWTSGSTITEEGLEWHRDPSDESAEWPSGEDEGDSWGTTAAPLAVSRRKGRGTSGGKWRRINTLPTFDVEFENAKKAGIGLGVAEVEISKKGGITLTNFRPAAEGGMEEVEPELPPDRPRRQKMKVGKWKRPRPPSRKAVAEERFD